MSFLSMAIGFLFSFSDGRLHSYFYSSLYGRHSQGDLHHQQRGGVASLVAQDYKNAGRISQRRVGAEVAVFGDSAGSQEMDHAGEELERSAKLLHRPVARAHDQATEIGIIHSQASFYLDIQSKC